MPLVWTVVGYANKAVSTIEAATLVGSSYMFGYTGGAPIPFVLKSGAEPPLIIAFQILPLIIVFSALSALLWHWGILRAMVRGLSFVLRRTLGVSGVVGLGGGATIFLGVVESPLVLRAWFGRMNRSDLFAIMVMIMATISGAILVLYATTLSKTVPDAVGHMIVASLISLPAALLIARLMVPGEPGASSEPADPELHYESTMDAIIRGTMEGVTLVLAVIGVIIVVFALVNLVDQALALLPLVEGAPLTLRRTLGWLLAPAMWAIGVPWDQAPAAGGTDGHQGDPQRICRLSRSGRAAGRHARSAQLADHDLCAVRGGQSRQRRADRLDHRHARARAAQRGFGARHEELAGRQHGLDDDRCRDRHRDIDVVTPAS